MEEKIKGTILGAVIGDALGSPVEGMSKGHIQSSFKKIKGYTDPSPGLKGKMEKWKMPGLYTSISQMMLLLSLFLIINKQFREKEFSKILKDLPEISDSGYSIFRHPGPVERALLKRLRVADSSPGENTFSFPCARQAVYLLPSILLHKSKILINDIINITFSFNKDINSAAGVLIFFSLIDMIIRENSAPVKDLPAFAGDAINSLLLEVEEEPGKIFSTGINPDALTASLDKYKKIFSVLGECQSKEHAEEKICSIVNSSLKSPITRATVNNPLAIIPYTIYIMSESISGPAAPLFTSVNEGGSASVLCSLSGALTGAIHGTEWIPDDLIKGLVNKTRVLTLVDQIAGNKANAKILDEFLESEASLTKKENQELNARLKHQKVKTKKKKSSKGREKELTRHVVESWTKMDQAKWRKKMDKKENRDNNVE